jgi:hypothetical protein
LENKVIRTFLRVSRGDRNVALAVEAVEAVEMELEEGQSRAVVEVPLLRAVAKIAPPRLFRRRWLGVARVAGLGLARDAGDLSLYVRRRCNAIRSVHLLPDIVLSQTAAYRPC